MEGAIAYPPAMAQQRRANAVRLRALTAARLALGIVALAALLTGAFVPQRITFHRGAFGPGFSAGFDVDRLDLALPWKARLSWAAGEIILSAPYLPGGVELFDARPPQR